MKKKGIRCQKVEYWNGFARKRIDLFGIIDIIALTPKGVVGIQVCGADFQPHIRKMTEENWDATRDWLETPGTTLILWSWRKVKAKRGGKRSIYKPRYQEITENDLLED